MSKPPKPSLSRVLIPEDFDKAQWVKEFKVLSKDAIIEERDRFRPFLRLKNDGKELVEELERIEKKQGIALMRERDTIRSFIDKQNQDLKQA
jgi:hypothetical protein